MKKVVEQLNNLPRARLSRTADLKIRTRIYRMQWQRYLENNYRFGVLNMKMASVMAVFIFFFLFVSVPVFAYASPGVVPGDMLYPLKRLVEKAELVLPKSKVNVAKMYEKNASRRLAEAEVLSKRAGSKSAEYLVATVNEAIADKSKASEIVNSIDDGAVDAMAPQENKKIQKQQEKLIKQVAQNVGMEADDRVFDSVSSMISVVSGDLNDQIAGEDQEEATSTKATSEMRDSWRQKRERTRATSSNDLHIPQVKKTETMSREFKGLDELDTEKKLINELAETIKRDDFSEKAAEKLRAKLESRSKKTNQALVEGDLRKAEELIIKSQLLIKNAKFFLKKEVKSSDEIKRKPDEIEKMDEKLKEPVESSRGTSTMEVQTDTEKSSSTKRQKRNKRAKED